MLLLSIYGPAQKSRYKSGRADDYSLLSRRTVAERIEYCARKMIRGQVCLPSRTCVISRIAYDISYTWGNR